ncbi:box C/D snoRNA protein 1 [Cynara cardunculus var. scolymus]|uniref:Box C/D snoRNA protein 1 n=1 Tax=Cynara cardunculus var. scolymus TaxID=59895 RepID=A0A118JXW7_CYNCS|nr:box C/D snoRNA protein 1 [Cynara cardunculus var. scolymus]KVH97076.1 Zinc finger, HIT-type [Cynara cardunculus var. scolymus]
MGEQEGGVVICSTKPLMEPPESSSKSCEECKTNIFKYKCPGCSVRSCSLPCVKAHKQRTGCTGKRQQHTEFVPLSQFDDNLILSDYNMLEDVKRIADSAKRRRLQLCGKFFHGLPHNLKSLMRAAGNRKIKLFFLPNGMSKRESNQTFFDNRNKSISWTIEWRFHSTNIKLFDHGVHEDSNLYSMIENHLKSGPRNHALQPFRLEPVESLKFFISKHPKQPRSPFRELDIQAPLRQQLASLVIIEYPVIHVFLPSHSLNFEVVKDIITHIVQPKPDPVKDSQPSPKGTFFREEEIKDHDSADPHVLDLMNRSNSKTEPKDIPKSLDSTNKNEAGVELGVADLMNFDFDPELVDVYSNLISETNPDDFLDMDSLLCDDMQLHEEKRDCKVIKEELEEGEIADSD